MKDPNIRPKTSKLVQERAGNTLELIDISSDLPNRIPMEQQLRQRNDKLDNMKLKSFYTTIKMTTILERQPKEWEKNLFCLYI
jgi:hypothetical protein